MSTVTVHDAIRLVLPHPAHVLAGQNGLYRSVSWPAMARAVAPLFTDLNGNEIALISLHTLRDVDPPISLGMLIERLAAVPVSAIVTVGNPDAGAIKSAEQQQIPLISLANDVDIREVERELQRLISDFDVQIERRSAQIALELGEQSLAGSGLAAMLALLGSRIDRSVALFSSKNELIAYHGIPEYRTLAQTIALRPGDQRVNGSDVWCHTLTAASQTIGTVVLLGLSLTVADRATVKRAAMALALELSKTQALSAVEERYRGNFLEQLLAGTLTDTTLLLQRARDAGVDTRKPHVAVLCVWPNTIPSAALNAIPPLLQPVASTISYMPHTLGLLCVVPCDTAHPTPHTTIQHVFHDILTSFPQVKLAFGRTVPHLTEWHLSLRDAELTALLLRQTAQVMLGYGDIGVYQLLLPIAETTDAIAFHHRHLGLLIDYENEPNGELLQTLAAYFVCNGNLARTAEHIHVHRNTLLYRLTRIAQICHVDLDDAETRLSMWLALKLHALLHTSGRE